MILAFIIIKTALSTLHGEGELLHPVTKYLFRLKEKRMDFNAGSLGLSLDVLIYIIRCAKLKSGKKKV